MGINTVLVTLFASASYAVAISSGCTTQVGLLAIGDVGNCLQLTSLLPLLSSSGSIVGPTNNYLSSLCKSSTPACSNDTLTSAQSSINSGCSSDLSGGGTNALQVQSLLGILKHYDQFHAAACSTNSTNHNYCVTDTIQSIQNATSTSIGLSDLISLANGGTNLTSAQLCTQCTSGIYYEALQANASFADTTLGKSLKSTCGSDFGKTAPNTNASSTTSKNSSSSSTGKGSSALVSTSSISLFTIVGTAGSILGTIFFGASLIL
ncbi:uncharacterized protein L203_103538 [Cryptococcus depauperatus CBS 7841]|uniref:DUF7729 domain-containing protein n=1 Tax=Cryptococcus depauperatus CBS 7841 TaxID=1295531 RepID=A0A1E3II92_9TREE|nr:hypothetical protein L203_02867 [Cryptococcus depauperatus CBS 7841]ODN97604.1 hypothetical protein L204_03023 [Cryptococcus depauperatus CBS 7855]